VKEEVEDLQKVRKGVERGKKGKERRLGQGSLWLPIERVVEGWKDRTLMRVERESRRKLVSCLLRVYLQFV